MNEHLVAFLAAQRDRNEDEKVVTRTREVAIRLAHVCVIGAGATGLTCALTLAKRGCQVTVLERDDELGGHARATLFNGHWRNPAFGAFQEKQCGPTPGIYTC